MINSNPHFLWMLSDMIRQCHFLTIALFPYLPYNGNSKTKRSLHHHGRRIA
nr:MAG TPA: hypothetical protein [Caudoviricetes sp.]